MCRFGFSGMGIYGFGEVFKLGFSGEGICGFSVVYKLSFSGVCRLRFVNGYMWV